jgi:hypothetical protein
MPTKIASSPFQLIEVAVPLIALNELSNAQEPFDESVVEVDSVVVRANEVLVSESEYRVRRPYHSIKKCSRGQNAIAKVETVHESPIPIDAFECR